MMRYLIIVFLILPVIFNGGVFGDANANTTLQIDCSHVKYPTDIAKTIAIMKYCTHAEKEVP